MSHFGHLAQRVFNTPVCIRPDKAEVIVCAIGERLGVARLDRLDGTTMGVIEMRAEARDAKRRQGGGKVYPEADGVAVIEVHGTTVMRGGLDPESGMTSYSGVVEKLRAARADPEVKAIWLDIDSPGGEAAGMFACAEEIAAGSGSEGGKPVWAYVNEQACSAAYALAAACDKVHMPDLGVVGSIGAYIMHADVSDALSSEGIKVTVIRAGERKARGTSVEPLDDPMLAKLQSYCDETRDRFVRFVANGRRSTIKAIADTEADWFTGKEAVNRGLVDGIMSEPMAWAKLQRSLARR